MAATDDGKPKAAPPETLSPAPHVIKQRLNQHDLSEDNRW